MVWEPWLISHQIGFFLKDQTYAVYKKLTLNRKHIFVKSKGRNIYHAKTNQKKNKVDFSANNITKNKEGDFIMIKEWIHQENITSLNVNVSKNKEIDTQRQINP